MDIYVLTTTESRAAVRSMSKLLLLLMHCLFILPCWGSVFVPCFVSFLVLQSYWRGRERAGCFTLIVFHVSCDCLCTVALPRGVVGWSAARDCGIS